MDNVWLLIGQFEVKLSAEFDTNFINLLVATSHSL